ncbi:MAG: hypothetical protein Q7S55_02290, partial [Nanoarchaeota archaeon]|nr:hypothetical protein [Nanoarchaeota archaeon]
MDRKRKLREDLERIANEEEAELEQLALDLEAHSQYQKAEVRLRTKDLSLVEEEDYEEAKKCVDGLLQKIEKTAKDRKEKRKRTAKFAAKVIGVTAAVLSLGYG